MADAKTKPPLSAGGWKSIAYFFVVVAWCAFQAGYNTHEWQRGSAGVFTNIDEHTPLNHGQVSIDMKLPHGERMTAFGECHPDWHADTQGEYWDRVTCNTEVFDPLVRGFHPAVPTSHWVQLDPPH